MKYSEILAGLIEDSGLSLGEIARRAKERGVKLDRSYLSKLKNGEVNPPSDEISNAIAEVLGVDPIKLIWAATIEKSHPSIKKSLMLIDSELMKKGIELEKKYPIPDDIDPIEADKIISNIPEYSQFYDELVQAIEQVAEKQSPYMFPAGKMVRIPVIGVVTAGPNGLAYQDYIGDEIVEEETVKSGKYFYLLVKGDSMIGDGIMDGDLVLIKETPNVENGELAVVIVNGEEGTLKRVYKKDGSIILHSSNPAYPPRIFQGKELENIRIVGKVKQTIRRY